MGGGGAPLLLNRALRKIHYAILLVRMGGPGVLFHQLRRQIYSRSTFLGLEKDLNVSGGHVPCRVEYILLPASGQDMEDVLHSARSDGEGSVHELLQRKWFYESGFHNCYVARAAKTGELCHVHWLISSEDDNVVSQGFQSRLPKLREGEVLLENAFTFEKHRGTGIMASVMAKLSEMAREKGFERMLAYVRDDNSPALKGCERVGFKRFEQVSEVKFLFFTFFTGKRHV
jgi:GNAT superfamily N-acetyltransferase